MSPGEGKGPLAGAVAGILLSFETASAPPAFNVMARFAVSVVMCRQQAMRIPLRGFSFTKRARISRRTGISRSAHSMRFFPVSAKRMFLTSDDKFMKFTCERLM